MQIVDLLPDLLPHVMACPTPVAVRALRESARNFCRKSHAILKTIDGESISTGQDIVFLSDFADDELELIGVLEFWVDGTNVPQVMSEAITSSQYLNTGQVGTPRAVYRYSEQEVSLWPIPDKDYTIKLLLATSPTVTADTIADDLGNRWKWTVIGGALEHLGMHPGQSYTSVNQAAWGASRFREGVGLARIERNRSFGAELQVQMRPFA